MTCQPREALHCLRSPALTAAVWLLVLHTGSGQEIVQVWAVVVCVVWYGCGTRRRVESCLIGVLPATIATMVPYTETALATDRQERRVALRSNQDRLNAVRELPGKPSAEGDCLTIRVRRSIPSSCCY